MQRTRTPALVLALLASCTPASERSESTMSEPTPTVTAATTPSATTPSEANDPNELEALALACEGRELARRFVGLDDEALAAIAGRSAGLLALWERARSFDAEVRIERAGVDALAAALERELGRPAPAWWLEQLASARRPHRRDRPYYDVGRTDTGDRRGPLVAGPGTTKLREANAMVVSSSEGRLTFDLSMGRIELGALPSGPNAVLELARAHAGSTIYWSSFSPGMGGFRFPLHAVDPQGQRWTAEVCGPDRQLLAGLDWLTVEIVVLEPPLAEPGVMQTSSGATGIAVFTAESHGVALDVFDPSTGARVLAWSSDFWFARGE
jgi:hypothetical protein